MRQRHSPGPSQYPRVLWQPARQEAVCVCGKKYNPPKRNPKCKIINIPSVGLLIIKPNTYVRYRKDHPSRDDICTQMAWCSRHADIRAKVCISHIIPHCSRCDNGTHPGVDNSLTRKKKQKKKLEILVCISKRMDILSARQSDKGMQC